MVGTEFSAILDLKVDKAYSAFLTPTEKNRIVKEATIKSIKALYRELDNQEDRDSLTAFVKTNKVFSLSGNSIYTNTSGSPNISDYDNIFAIKAKFIETLYGVSVSNATNTSPIIITLSGVNNIRSGEQIDISGVTGNTNANGTFYVKKIKSNQMSLYSDANLQTPVSGNGAYISGGVVGRVFYNYCLPILSDKKIDPYSQATVRDPRFEIADNKIKITPNNINCPEITIDYLAVPVGAQFIDVTNNSIDLELTYPLDFLYMIAEEYANLFAQAFKDGELFQTSNFELQKNS